MGGEMWDLARAPRHVEAGVVEAFEAARLEV